MKVKLTTSRAGSGFLQRPGEIIDLPTDEAAALLRAGSAERVSTEPAETPASVETATAAPPNRNAATRTAPPRNRSK